MRKKWKTKRPRRVKTRRSRVVKRKSSRRTSKKTYRKRSYRKKKSNTADLQANNQETSLVLKDVVGRKTNFISKVVTANLQADTLRFQAINPYMNEYGVPARNNSSRVFGGAFSLRNVGGTLGTTLYTPLHLYDITSTINYNPGRGTVLTYNPAHELTFLTSTGTSQITSAAFVKMQGDVNNGGYGLQTSWARENDAGVSGANLYPNRRTYLNWVDVKLYCYGCTYEPVTYTISVVQIKDDWHHPDTLGLPTYDSTGAVYTNQRANFWSEKVKPLITHPCADEWFMNYNGLRVIKKHTFTIQPLTIASQLLGDRGGTTAHTSTDLLPPLTTNTTTSLTYNSNTSNCIPKAKKVKLRIPINKVMKYDWAESVMDAALGTSTSYAIEGASVDAVVHPKSRIYIMITATNRVNTFANPLSNCDHEPSYDINIRKKYTNIT